MTVADSQAAVTYALNGGQWFVRRGQEKKLVQAGRSAIALQKEIRVVAAIAMGTDGENPHSCWLFFYWARAPIIMLYTGTWRYGSGEQHGWLEPPPPKDRVVVSLATYVRGQKKACRKPAAEWGLPVCVYENLFPGGRKPNPSTRFSQEWNGLGDDPDTYCRFKRLKKGGEVFDEQSFAATYDGTLARIEGIYLKGALPQRGEDVRGRVLISIRPLVSSAIDSERFFGGDAEGIFNATHQAVGYLGKVEFLTSEQLVHPAMVLHYCSFGSTLPVR